MLVYCPLDCFCGILFSVQKYFILICLVLGLSVRL